MIGVLEQPCIAGLARQTSATGQQKTRHARKHAGFRRAFSDCAGLPCGAPGKHFDSLWLYLELTPAGGRYWRMKYAIAGEEKRQALGVYPQVTLKQAREQADAARKILQPSAAKKQSKERATTDTVSDAVLVLHSGAAMRQRPTRSIRASRQSLSHCLPILPTRYRPQCWRATFGAMVPKPENPCDRTV